MKKTNQKQKLIKAIEYSKVLNYNEKKIFIHYITKKILPKSKVETFIKIMRNEEQIIKESEKSAEQINLQKIQDWHQKLTNILNIDIFDSTSLLKFA